MQYEEFMVNIIPWYYVVQIKHYGLIVQFGFDGNMEQLQTTF